MFSDLLGAFDDPHPQPGARTLFLASETIYSPSSIRPFTEVLLKALEKAAGAGGFATALVAAKRMYFGVGGGVDEFTKVSEELGGITSIVWESGDTGVGRIILRVFGKDQSIPGSGIPSD